MTLTRRVFWFQVTLFRCWPTGLHIVTKNMRGLRWTYRGLLAENC